MPATIPPQRALLGRALRELRASAFPSGSALARHLGWQQTRVSKLESGHQWPTDDDLDAWADATDASAERRAELHALASAARIEYATFSQRYHRHGGPVAEQQTTTDEDARSTRILEFQPAMIPGLLQTPAYAREVLSLACGPSASGATAEDIEGIVAARMARQHVLYEQSHTIRLVVGEAALHTRFGDREVLAGQLDRLISLAGLAGVEFGIIPFSTPMPAFPLTNFIVYDDHVLIESITAQQRLDSADEIALYARFFDQLADAALTDTPAVGLLHQVAADLREPAAR